MKPADLEPDGKEAAMSRLVLFAVAVLVSTSCALGDWIVSRGETMQIWFYQGQGPQIQFSIVYEEPGGVDPNTLIGDDLWFSMPGTYDLSLDDQFQAFLSQATNGQKKKLRLSLADRSGAEVLFPFLSEGLMFGHYPDLAPLEITGALLNVEYMHQEPDGFMIVLRMEFMGIPEPSSVLTLAGMGPLLLMRRVRPCP